MQERHNALASHVVLLGLLPVSHWLEQKSNAKNMPKNTIGRTKVYNFS
jgi:hypothetical protein